jgi:hypothetical protein
MLSMMAAPDRSYKAMVALSASALMVILVAHLVVMATPLHDLRMQAERPTDAASMLEPHDGLRLPVGAQFAAMGDVSDCAIVWTVLARQIPGLSITAVAVSTVSVMLVVAPYGRPPLPRTLSPPLGTDRQALLQVFRL